ncbi:MAG TPA: exodeoxyribonuclease VII small subunit [Gemmataceae bacterium]|nr:exodeoxyribonuclease VII small subunit [Gemmataceae bacterium]
MRDERMSEPQSDNLTFEQALAQLEGIVRELEDGQTGLEEALTRYETGVKLLKRCYFQLNQAEQRILLLTGQDESGQPVTQPFEHAATAGSEKTESQPRRKKKIEEPENLF